MRPEKNSGISVTHIVLSCFSFSSFNNQCFCGSTAQFKLVTFRGRVLSWVPEKLKPSLQGGTVKHATSQASSYLCGTRVWQRLPQQSFPNHHPCHQTWLLPKGLILPEQLIKPQQHRQVILRVPFKWRGKFILTCMKRDFKQGLQGKDTDIVSYCLKENRARRSPI